MRPPGVPAPPAPFPNVAIQTVPKGTILYRTHLTTLRSAQFNPCVGQPTRFAPFKDTAGACVPTLYGAATQEAAAFETIFHDIEPTAQFKTIRRGVVEARSVSRIAPKRDLMLARLFAPDLKAWGLRRTQLIETPKSTYGQTVLWARAIHLARSDIDGLIWTSRQCDPDVCVVLFGGRVNEADFNVLACTDVGANAAMLRTLRDYGRRAGITLVS